MYQRKRGKTGFETGLRIDYKKARERWNNTDNMDFQKKDYCKNLKRDDYESDEEYLKARVTRGRKAGDTFRECYEHWLDEFKNALGILEADEFKNALGIPEPEAGPSTAGRE